jgi:hypothetical protein
LWFSRPLAFLLSGLAAIAEHFGAPNMLITSMTGKGMALFRNVVLFDNVCMLEHMV